MENKETILQLYNNYIDDIYTTTYEKLEVTKEIADLEEVLNKTLTDEQKKLLEEIHTKESEKQELIYKQVFVFAYSLANKLLIESLTDNKRSSNNN